VSVVSEWARQRSICLTGHMAYLHDPAEKSGDGSDNNKSGLHTRTLEEPEGHGVSLQVADHILAHEKQGCVGIGRETRWSRATYEYVPPWRWRQQFPPKHRCPSAKLHGSTFPVDRDSLFTTVRSSNYERIKWPPLWFLATDPEVQVRFQALSNFLRSSGSWTGTTHPREYNWEATWKKIQRLESRKSILRP
jgi:hypothetical protein